MEIRPAMRVIEVGNIVYSPSLQRKPLGTEAQYLLARYIFETLGYRRYEWKCNALNAPSRRAALRYGFVFEGILRQHMIAKGRNRDTAYYSMLDSEWPARRAASPGLRTQMERRPFMLTRRPPTDRCPRQAPCTYSTDSACPAKLMSITAAGWPSAAPRLTSRPSART